MDDGPAAAGEDEHGGTAGGVPGGAGYERLIGHEADLGSAVADAEHRRGGEH
jgi:hypothetical protein